MSGMTTYLEGQLADGTLGGGTWTKPGTVYIGLNAGFAGETGANEVAVSGYARKASTNNATNWPNLSADIKQNGVEELFAELAADANGVSDFSIWDASSAGNCLFTGMLIDTTYGWKGFLGTASDDLITLHAHALTDTQEVRISAIPGVALPTGIADGDKLFVRDATTDTFKLAATSGGAAINLTGNGFGLIAKSKAKNISNGTQPRFAAGTLQLRWD